MSQEPIDRNATFTVPRIPPQQACLVGIPLPNSLLIRSLNPTRKRKRIPTANLETKMLRLIEILEQTRGQLEKCGTIPCDEICDNKFR